MEGLIVMSGFGSDGSCLQPSQHQFSRMWPMICAKPKKMPLKGAKLLQSHLLYAQFCFSQCDCSVVSSVCTSEQTLNLEPHCPCSQRQKRALDSILLGYMGDCACYFTRMTVTTLIAPPMQISFGFVSARHDVCVCFAISANL